MATGVFTVPLLVAQVHVKCAGEGRYMKRTVTIAGIGLLLLAGLGLLFFPVISNWLAERNQTEAIQEYDAALSAMSKEQLEAEMQKARAYNDALSGVQIKDPFIPGSGFVLPEEYTSVLAIGGTIGYIEIPVIDVSLPIYHGTAEAVLKRGVGHMDMTAFPIGGQGNHSVLTGHTGLPSAKLFTDLHLLETGDKFYIRVLNETLAYEVDQILVVTPENTESLRPEKGEDLVTLITCTPYGVNSHRLLVRGARVPYVAGEPEQTIKEAEKQTDWRFVIFIVFLILLAMLIVIRTYKNSRRKRGGV